MSICSILLLIIDKISLELAVCKTEFVTKVSIHLKYKADAYIRYISASVKNSVTFNFS
jgi:hypothetical protein